MTSWSSVFRAPPPPQSIPDYILLNWAWPVPCFLIFFQSPKEVALNHTVTRAEPYMWCPGFIYLLLFFIHHPFWFPINKSHSKSILHLALTELYYSSLVIFQCGESHYARPILRGDTSVSYQTQLGSLATCDGMQFNMKKKVIIEKTNQLNIIRIWAEYIQQPKVAYWSRRDTSKTLNVWRMYSAKCYLKYP